MLTKIWQFVLFFVACRSCHLSPALVFLSQSKLALMQFHKDDDMDLRVGKYKRESHISRRKQKTVLFSGKFLSSSWWWHISLIDMNPKNKSHPRAHTRMRVHTHHGTAFVSHFLFIFTDTHPHTHTPQSMHIYWLTINERLVSPLVDHVSVHRPLEPRAFSTQMK